MDSGYIKCLLPFFMILGKIRACLETTDSLYLGQLPSRTSFPCSRACLSLSLEVRD